MPLIFPSESDWPAYISFKNSILLQFSHQVLSVEIYDSRIIDLNVLSRIFLSYPLYHFSLFVNYNKKYSISLC